MEYLGRGDLSHYIEQGLEDSEAREIAENILNGLRVMHFEGFTHRDIKPQVSIIWCTFTNFIFGYLIHITSEYTRRRKATGTWKMEG